MQLQLKSHGGARRLARVVACVAAVACWPVAAAHASGDRNAHAAFVQGCPSSVSAGQATIRSVRNLSCRAALRVYVRAHGDQHVPIRLHQRARIGGYRCVVYRDLTPPGPSDSDVLVRCARGSRAFRFEYAV